MKAEIKDLWLKALRSGEFPQGREYLDKGGKYCVLGVLASLAMLEGQCTYQPQKSLGSYDKRLKSLSYNVMKWAGIGQDEDDEDGIAAFLKPKAGLVPLVHKGKKTTLADLNDSGLSFIELSDIIEKLWRDL